MPKFWTSSRFWALALLAIVYLLGAYGLLPSEIVNGLYVILGGHVGIRSFDRFSDRLGAKK